MASNSTLSASRSVNETHLVLWPFVQLKEYADKHKVGGTASTIQPVAQVSYLFLILLQFHVSN